MQVTTGNPLDQRGRRYGSHYFFQKNQFFHASLRKCQTLIHTNYHPHPGDAPATKFNTQASTQGVQEGLRQRHKCHTSKQTYERPCQQLLPRRAVIVPCVTGKQCKHAGGPGRHPAVSSARHVPRKPSRQPNGRATQLANERKMRNLHSRAQGLPSPLKGQAS